MPLTYSQLLFLITGVAGTVGHVGYEPTTTWPYSQRIYFSPPFDGTPTITYGLFRLDSSDDANLRVEIIVSNVSKIGFQLTLRAWADTELYGASVSWMACGK